MNVYKINLEVKDFKVTDRPEGSELVRTCTKVGDFYNQGKGKGYWSEKYRIEYSDRDNKLIQTNFRVVFWFEIGKDKKQDAWAIRRAWLQGRDKIAWFLRDNSAIEPEDLSLLPIEAPDISLFEANGVYDEN
jgi:hypothetical protein